MVLQWDTIVINFNDSFCSKCFKFKTQWQEIQYHFFEIFGRQWDWRKWPVDIGWIISQWSNSLSPTPWSSFAIYLEFKHLQHKYNEIQKSQKNGSFHQIQRLLSVTTGLHFTSMTLSKVAFSLWSHGIKVKFSPTNKFTINVKKRRECKIFLFLGYLYSQSAFIYNANIFNVNTTVSNSQHKNTLE